MSKPMTARQTFEAFAKARRLWQMSVTFAPWLGVKDTSDAAFLGRVRVRARRDGVALDTMTDWLAVGQTLADEAMARATDKTWPPSRAAL